MSKKLYILFLVGVIIVSFATYIGFLLLKPSNAPNITNTSLKISLSNNAICPNCNVVLISIDTLRADHMGCYGYFRNTTPEIDKFANKSIVFENTFSQTFWTLPSHMAMFTGLYPSSVIVKRKNMLAKIPKDTPTIAEILKSLGYDTGGFTGGGYVSSLYGFSRGFDIYEEKHWFSQTVPLAISWLNTTKPHKFFIFLHGYDVHKPYDNKPEPYNSMFTDLKYNGFLKRMTLGIKNLRSIRNGKFYFENGTVINLTDSDISYVIAHYDGGIRYTDHWIGSFIKYLENKRLLNNTIVVITSDHGEDLMEHGNFGHWNIYDNMIHVPLIIYVPKMHHKKITSFAETIDIVPTVLDLLGIRLDYNFNGKSLLPIILSSKKGRSYIISEYVSGAPKGIYWMPEITEVCVRNNEWKFIFHIDSKNELYNIKLDHSEKVNLIRKGPKDIVQKLENITIEYIEKTERVSPKEYIKIEKELKQIGYIQ